MDHGNFSRRVCRSPSSEYFKVEYVVLIRAPQTSVDGASAVMPLIPVLLPSMSDAVQPGGRLRSCRRFAGKRDTWMVLSLFGFDALSVASSGHVR